jgi:orotate phosphoribosyltransferase
MNRTAGRGSFKSPTTSETYFDKYQFESDPNLLKAMAGDMAALVPDETEILAGLEMGAPLAAERRNRYADTSAAHARGAGVVGLKTCLID